MKRKATAQSTVVPVDIQSIKECIHVVRGVQVILDFDLAALYGYSTKDFNRQVKNNIEKFDADFMFLLTADEIENLRCKKFTSSWGGARYLPHAFTEQGVYTSVEFADFCKEHGKVELKTTGGIFHDRYIILDFGTPEEKIYHCGASSKRWWESSYDHRAGFGFIDLSAARRKTSTKSGVDAQIEADSEVQ